MLIYIILGDCSQKYSLASHFKHTKQPSLTMHKTITNSVSGVMATR